MFVLLDPAVAPGSKGWFCAYYYNAKGQNGFACQPVGTNLPGGSALAA